MSRSRRAQVSTWAATGALSAGVLGGIAGLLVGLRAHPATAWFAVFELGIPASIIGGIVGLVSHFVVSFLDRQ